jgi:hypothetical protein
VCGLCVYYASTVTTLRTPNRTICEGFSFTILRSFSIGMSQMCLSVKANRRKYIVKITHFGLKLINIRRPCYIKGRSWSTSQKNGSTPIHIRWKTAKYAVTLTDIVKVTSRIAIKILLFITTAVRTSNHT